MFMKSKLFFVIVMSVIVCSGCDIVDDIIGSKYSVENAKDKWGVDEFVVRQTSSGDMLDIRYRVIDKDKAKPLFDRKVRPFIIEEDSGNTFGVPASPKVGFMRQAPRHIKEDKKYFYARPIRKMSYL